MRKQELIIPAQSAKPQISAMLKATLFWSSFQPITNCAAYLKKYLVMHDNSLTWTDVTLDCIAGVYYPMINKHMACLL